MKRLAIISEHASPLAVLGGVDGGGQNVYVAHVARGLAHAGWEVDVFTRRDDTEMPEVVEWQDGVRVIHVPAGPPSFVPKEDLLGVMPQFSSWVCDFAEREGGYDVAHANFFMSGMVAEALRERMGTPFAITFHALGKLRRRFQGSNDGFSDRRFAIEERLVAGADAIIAECPQDERDLTELYRAPADKIRIIPCGFDPEEMWPMDQREARQQLGLPDDGPIVLQLGRMVPRKGVDDAIRGFGQMVHRYGVDGALVIVGGEAEDAADDHSAEMARLHEVAARENVADRVRFEGRRSRDVLRLYYSAANVFVSVPWYEPFGITPVEAMACATPVIGSGVGGIKYTVVDGETGYLVSPKDPLGLGERMARVCSDPVLAAALSASALRRVNMLFTWKRVVQQLEAAFEALIAPVPLPTMASFDGDLVRQRFAEARRTIELAEETLADDLVHAADELRRCFARGGKVLVCGNGGSATDAQHFAAELVGRYCAEGCAPLPALALTADSAVMTAWSNDVGYEDVFARQVDALAVPGDLVIGISTSGNSPNIIRALEKAREKGVATIGLLGGDGGVCRGSCDSTVIVPAKDTPRVQEVHGVALHLLAEMVESSRATTAPDVEQPRAALTGSAVS